MKNQSFSQERLPMTIHRRSAVLACLLFTFSLAAACPSRDDDDDPCDPTVDDVCPCDPADSGSCPDDFICRPANDGSVCVPEASAGRIPSCFDEEGLDVFAAEANGAVSVSWKVNSDINRAGGFSVLFGTLPETYVEAAEVGPDAAQATLRPLLNGTTYFIVVEPLDADGEPTFRSCEVAAVPHVLEFAADVGLPGDTGGDQNDPDLASSADGERLYLAWDDEGTITLGISEDFGDSWTVRALGAGQRPAVTVREATFDEDGILVIPEAAVIAWQAGGDVVVGTFASDGDSLTEPASIGSGGAPDLTSVQLTQTIHIAFEQGGGIATARSDDGGATFDEPVRLEGAFTQNVSPSIAVSAADEGEGAAFVAWSAVDGAGDSNVYGASSDAPGVVRIDDDSQGQNQLEISVAVDPQTGTLYATWEDRRGGANVYFSRSLDGGVTWEENIDVGVGLGGDQFRPQAVVDAAGNVYVAFQDTSDGQRVVFSRFNEEGTFDPPLAPSTAAGQGGVVGDNPTVATDRFGTVFVAWEENRVGPDSDIIFARAE